MFVRKIDVLSRIKRFLGTKRFAEFIWFHLKRFRGTKLPEDCPLWPAAYEVERIAPTGRTGPHGPTGRRTWDPSFPYHMFDVYGFPRYGQTHETSQNANRQGLLQNLACILAPIRPVDTYKGVLVLPSGFEPKPSEPESEILSIRLWEQKGTGTKAAMRN